MERDELMNKKGISLIVLTITVAVMAILASTTVVLLDQTELVDTSKSTVKQQNKVIVLEELNSLKNTLITENYGKITVDEYISYLMSIGKAKANITENKDGSKSFVTYNKYVANATQDGEFNLIIDVEGEEKTDKPKIDTVKLISDESSINVNVEMSKGVYVEYTYSYRLSTAEEFTVVNNVPTKQRQQKIEGLLPHSNYIVKVTAKNEYGEIAVEAVIDTK